MFTFDGTVNLGQLLEVGSIVGGGLVALFKMQQEQQGLKKDVALIDKRLDKVDVELKKQTEILIALGQQDARLTSLEERFSVIGQHLLQHPIKD